MATIVNGIENSVLGQIQFEPAPHNHDASNDIRYASKTHNHDDRYITSVKINGTETRSPQFYAPETGGAANQILITNKNGYPEWVDNKKQSDNSLINESNCFLYFKDNVLIHFIINNDDMFVEFLESLLKRFKDGELTEIIRGEEKGLLNLIKKGVIWNMPGTPEFSQFLELLRWFFMHEEDFLALTNITDYKNFLQVISYEKYMESFPIGHKGWIFSYTRRMIGDRYVYYCPIEFINNIVWEDDGKMVGGLIQVYELKNTYKYEGSPEIVKPIYEIVPKK